MPAIQKVARTRGREFWDSLDHNNLTQVLEAVTKGQRSNKVELFLTAYVPFLDKRKGYKRKVDCLYNRISSCFRLSRE
jgi:hypothetical protein